MDAVAVVGGTERVVVGGAAVVGGAVCAGSMVVAGRAVVVVKIAVAGVATGIVNPVCEERGTPGTVVLTVVFVRAVES